MKTDTNNAYFKEFADLMQTLADTRSTNAKISLFAEYISQLTKTEDLRLACQFTGEGAFSSISGKRASVGHRTIAVAAADFCEIDYDLVFRACRTATGSSTESIKLLFENFDTVKEKQHLKNLTLQEIGAIFQQLESAKKRVHKNEILINVFQSLNPVEVKYFLRLLSQGSLRIGFEARSIINALAKAFNVELESVRYAHMITGSLGETAVMCKNKALDKASFQMFNPIAFMLASPAEPEEISNIEEYLAEEKFDGMRCQVHVESGTVKLFSRDLNEISSAFPELLAFFESKNISSTVLDGEVCVVKDQAIMPFQHLQKRMGVKKPNKKLLEQYPVQFIAYDIMFLDKAPLFKETLIQRRKHLDFFCKKFEIPITRQFSIQSAEDVKNMFAKALAYGNEGLMLKHRDSEYEYGQRRRSWIKIKEPSGSFDTVIMYAHAGSGKRGGTYSDFTLGVSVKEDDRYSESFIPIGKAYGGYTDDELKKLNTAIKPLIVERFGPTLSLKPGIVVELEFDDIQINKRTKAGYTLRFPRFRRIRWDLSPNDVNTLSDVEKMFAKKANAKPLNQADNHSFISFD